MMQIDEAFFILKHGSSEGEYKYFEAVQVIEQEYKKQKAYTDYLHKRCLQILADYSKHLKG